MPLNRLRLALVFVASCGGEARATHVTMQAPQGSAQPPPVVLDAGAPPEVACLAPLENGKPIDAQKLDEAKQASSEPERSFRVGRVYFEAEHWVEAAKIYRSIAFEQPDSNVGIYSSQLYLECINQLAAHAHRARCYDDMARDVPALDDLYCTARRNAEMCATLARVRVDIERLRAQRLLEEGVAKGNPKMVHESGEQFLAMVRAHCMPALSDASRCDEIAFNAAAAFIASGDNASAERVRALMADPKNGMHHSPLLQKLECKLDPTPRPSCR